MKPITPNEVASQKLKTMPEGVLAAFNELIASKYTDGISVVTQDDVIKLIFLKTDINRAEVFKEGYLNVEEIYREAGWKVEYDKPGYNESCSPFFTFRG